MISPSRNQSSLSKERVSNKRKFSHDFSGLEGLTKTRIHKRRRIQDQEGDIDLIQVEVASLEWPEFDQ